MRSLYLRVFAWFWVTTVAVAVAVVISSPLFTRSRPGVERWQRTAEGALETRVEEVARRLGAGDSNPLRRPGGGRADGSPRGPGPRSRGDGLRLPTFVLSPEGVALAGPQPPAEVAAFARRVARAGEARSERSGTLHLVGRPATSPAGEAAVVVAAVRRPPGLLDLLEPGALAWRLALLTAVVGLVCLWLARQLASPVEDLRRAVRRLAGGDLAARASTPIARRRDEIGDLARDFNAMAERLEGLVGAQRRLVRDVSHELRSPLSRLAVALELARRRADATVSEPLDRIELEAGRLDDLVGQLLTLSRLEAADVPATSEPVDLAALAGEVAADAAFEASAAGVAVTVTAPGPAVVAGDSDGLRSALDNVVRNAVRYSEGGGGVEVRVAGEGGQVVARVLDRGPGVPPEQIGGLFEPFFRVEEARDRQRGGVGLGLAITSRTVRLHGGTVAAVNRDGGGLEVTLRLPAAARSASRPGGRGVHS